MNLPTITDEKIKKTSLGKKLVALAHQAGLFSASHRLWAKSLTVLNYHRIDEPENSPDTFLPNISATPEEFQRQMAYLSRWFNVVSLQDVTNWLSINKPLPHHAALITFDDGYLDNYTNAFPILRKFNFPAVIYLTSGHIAADRPFYWDLAAYCFFHTKRDHFPFPDGRERKWETQQEKSQILKQWIETLKRIEESEKDMWVNRIPDLLNVAIPKDFFRKLIVNWDQVREMSTNGMDFGAHTITHPILTRISEQQINQEIKGSKKKIEDEIGRPVSSLAYPNGMRADVNNDVVNITKNSGFMTAFTLLNGPTSLSEVKKNPYIIRRIFISHRHTIPQFSLLTSPFNRIRPS
jgi:peptidoglycan/xylan/chitin deacetylase (PgdA/CDA1 family)